MSWATTQCGQGDGAACLRRTGEVMSLGIGVLGVVSPAQHFACFHPTSVVIDCIGGRASIERKSAFTASAAVVDRLSPALARYRGGSSHPDPAAAAGRAERARSPCTATAATGRSPHATLTHTVSAQHSGGPDRANTAQSSLRTALDRERVTQPSRGGGHRGMARSRVLSEAQAAGRTRTAR